MNTRPALPHDPYPSAQTVHATDYLRILYKRRWTAGLAFLVVFVLGAVNTLKKTPLYEASAQLLIEKDARRPTSLNTVLSDQDAWSDEDFYQTQYRILQSRQLALKAVESLGWNRPVASAAANATPVNRGLVSSLIDRVSALVGAPKKIDPPPADETTAQSATIDEFLGGLQVAALRNTHLVDVRYLSPDPMRAAQAANAVARMYRQHTLDARLLASKEATDYLTQQLEEQKTKVEASDRALQDYKETHDAVSLDAPQNIVVTKLADLSAQLTSATTVRLEKEAAYHTLVQLQESGERSKLEAFPAIMANADIQKLKTEVRTLDSRRTELKARGVGEKNPDMIAANGAYDQKTAQLQIEIDKSVDAVRNDYLTAKGREDSLKAALETQKSVALGLDRKGIEYESLKRDAASNRQLYENLMARAKETGVSGQFTGSSIEIVDPAEIPREPILPKTSRDLMVALLAGCLAALGLAFGFEYLDNRIRTPDELTSQLGLTFLGLVPVVSAKDAGQDSPMITSDAPSTFSEAVRAIRTAVIFSSAAEGARSVVVTSTAPSEGKTVVSTNLAAALAQADQRTLIVDGDMRKPRVHDVFARSQEPGLSNVLVGTAELHEAIKPTPVKNLFLLPAGHLPPNPAELLGSVRYAQLMDNLQHQFDWIVIDAPPVMAVTDAAVIANRATGVVFVVGAEMTPKRTARAAIDQLIAAKARFIGGVLNRVHVERHSYYYAPYYRKDYTQAYSRTQ
jgi:capsular exopolysaccharide synthesis family protein